MSGTTIPTVTANITVKPDHPAYIKIKGVFDFLSSLPPQDARRELYLAYLIVLNGQTEQPKRQCTAFVSRHWRLVLDSPETLNVLAEVNFLMGDFSSLREFTRLAYGVPCDVIIAPKGSTRGGPGVAKWVLGGEGPMTFIFDAVLYEHPFMNVILKHWIQVISIYCYFKTISDIKEGEVFLSLEDMGTLSGITFCDFRDDFTLIPDPIFMQTGGYANAKKSYDESGISWPRRKDQAIWRGTTTGWFDCSGQQIVSWRDLPRVKLCMLAAEPGREQFLDAGLTGLAQIGTADAETDLKALTLQKPYMNSSNFQHYKYQIDIDGNSNAWPGLFLKLCTGSVVLKVASSKGFRQWYYDRLIPWFNFVPVEPDMSDLFDKLSWLRRRDNLAETIGRNGRQLAASMTATSEMLLAERHIQAAFARGLPY